MSETEGLEHDLNPTFWLVETAATDNSPARWWHPERGWCVDWSKALRFARKEDAEDFACSHHMRGCLARFASEHRLIDLAQAGASRPVGGEEIARKALSEAATTFRRYEELHRAKGTSEGSEKAYSNHLMAVMMEEALSLLSGSEAAGDGWRPIETAPKDGTVFVALSLCNFGELYDSPDHKPFSCWWEPEDSFSPAAWVRQVHGSHRTGKHVAYPTHWMPLPPAPTPSGVQEQGGGS